jgi:predicted CopG family antitoxin
MSRKLTISVSEEVYQGLYRTVGRRRISQFLEKLARPHVLSQDIEAAYRDMAADREREREALAWSEGPESEPRASRPDHKQRFPPLPV